MATSITVIDVGLILSLMLTGGSETAALTCDTVFAAAMIIIAALSEYAL